MTEERVGGVDFNVIISRVLRYGVVLSSAVVVIGIALVLLRERPADFPSTIGELVSTGFGRPTLRPSELVAGVASLNATSVIDLGLIILLATPIVRVATSVFFFAAEKDAIYVVVTLFVLAMLLLGIFVIGPLESGSAG